MDFGETTVPVKFTPKSIFTISEIECPSWATIKAVTVPVRLAVATDANMIPIFFTNTIPLPIFLTQVIVTYRAPLIEDVSFLCMDACAKYDKEKEDADPAASTFLKTILPLLWVANISRVTAVHASTQASLTIVRIYYGTKKNYPNPIAHPHFSRLN